MRVFGKTLMKNAVMHKIMYRIKEFIIFGLLLGYILVTRAGRRHGIPGYLLTEHHEGEKEIKSSIYSNIKKIN